MPTRRFPLQRLPDDLGLMVLKTMEYHEIFAFSFTSKKSLSMVTALRLPIRHVKLAFPNEIAVLFDRAYYSFYLNWHGNDNQIRTLNDLPTSVDIRLGNLVTWSNQGKTIDEWIQHVCSISQQENRREVSINTRKARLNVQSLRNTFPRLKKVSIHCSGEELNENGISSSETVLRAFLPNLETLLLYGLPPNRLIGSIGMANLNELHVYLDGSPYNLKLEDLLSLNVKTFIIMVNEFSIRDLNRFFKMWIKGSNSKLEDLEIYGHFERFPDWNVLLKGLKAVEEEEEEGSDEPQEGGPKEAEAVEEPEDAQDDEDQEDYEEVEDEDEEDNYGYEQEEESEADEPQGGRVEAVEAQNEPEGEAQEVRIEEAEAVAEESEENEYDEECEEEEDEEDIEDDNDYENEGSEYEDEEEPEEAHIVPVAQVAENTAVVKTYTIRNSLGISAEIETEFNRRAYVNVGLKFTVFN